MDRIGVAAKPSHPSIAFSTASTYNASLSSSLSQETGCLTTAFNVGHAALGDHP
jgi:hypothetical protein